MTEPRQRFPLTDSDLVIQVAPIKASALRRHGITLLALIASLVLIGVNIADIQKSREPKPIPADLLFRMNGHDPRIYYKEPLSI